MLDRDSGELMHPGTGPLVEPESLYVVPSRLAQRLALVDGSGRDATADPLVVFDVGLGAGSNAAAAFRLSESLGGPRRLLSIVSFDRSLAALELALAPEHAAAFGLDGDAGLAARQLVARGSASGRYTAWRLVEGPLPGSLALSAQRADIVFWDPFSPAHNSELWSCAAFRALRAQCRDGATVHTYSGATAVRSALLIAGFNVAVGPRIAQGKHGTIASAGGELPGLLDRRWLERLSRSSAPLPADAPAGAFERIAAMSQFSAQG